MRSIIGWARADRHAWMLGGRHTAAEHPQVHVGACPWRTSDWWRDFGTFGQVASGRALLVVLADADAT